MAKKRFFGMLAMMLILGMTVIGCEDPNGGGGGDGGGDEPTDVEQESIGETIGPLALEELSAALSYLPENTAIRPHLVRLDSSCIINTGDTSTNGVWATVNSTVQSAEKYVILDLGACTAAGNTVTGALSPTRNKMNIINGNQYVKGIVLPDTLTSIGDDAFYQCTALTRVTIGTGVTNIDDGAFWDCKGLTKVTIPVRLAHDIYFIASFSGTAGLSVVLTGTGSIADDAFARCTKLVSVTIGPGVTGIGDDAFYQCTALTSVTIGEGVIGIGDSVFDGCVNLATVTVDKANSAYSSGDGILFNKAKTSLLYCPPQAHIGNYTIPASVTSIASGAFYNCKWLTGVTIPATVTSIGAHIYGSRNLGNGTSVYYWEYGAFYNCSALKSVTMPVGLTEGFAGKFEGYSNLALALTGTGSVPNNAFQSVHRPESGSYSYCTGITSVTIGNGVTGIGGGAFSGCTGLKSVTMPGSVTSIGQSAFSGCTALTGVAIPGNVTSIGQSAFSGCSSITGVTIPGGVTSIEQATFSGCTALAGVTIGEGVETIGAYAFSGCSALKSVTIPNSVDEFQKFLEGLPVVGDIIEKINSDDYVDGVSTIGSYAFSGCTSLTSVTLGGPGIYDHNHYLEDLIDALGILLNLLNFSNPLAQIQAMKDFYDIASNTNNNDRGFYDNAFPQGAGVGNNLKTAYLTGGKGTYTRTSTSATAWTKN